MAGGEARADGREAARKPRRLQRGHQWFRVGAQIRQQLRRLLEVDEAHARRGGRELELEDELARELEHLVLEGEHTARVIEHEHQVERRTRTRRGKRRRRRRARVGRRAEAAAAALAAEALDHLTVGWVATVRRELRAIRLDAVDQERRVGMVAPVTRGARSTGRRAQRGDSAGEGRSGAVVLQFTAIGWLAVDHKGRRGGIVANRIRGQPRRRRWRRRWRWRRRR